MQVYSRRNQKRFAGFAFTDTLPSPATLRIAPAEALARYIDLLCLMRGVAPTRFGREAVGDPNLVGRLKTGRFIRPATRDRILAHFAVVREDR